MHYLEPSEAPLFVTRRFLSILYLRCRDKYNLLKQYIDAAPFNSLFEMHDVLREAAEHFENALSILYLRCTQGLTRPTRRRNLQIRFQFSI